MSLSQGDRAFIDAIPEVYERLLVPLIFEAHALDLAARIARTAPLRVLEIAAGTGVLTRQLAVTLPEKAAIVATDLNQPMLDQAIAIGTKRPVEWQVADALSLPFPDGSFDAVACQFGVMFFPDKPRAYSEIHRVLRPQGHFFFSAWDRIEINDFAALTEAALAELFADNPPRFLSRTPHGYHDPTIIRRELEEGGFSNGAEINAVAARSRAPSAHIAATAYCLGTPLRSEIEARTASPDTAIAKAAEAIARRFGASAVDGKIQALVAGVRR